MDSGYTEDVPGDEQVDPDPELQRAADAEVGDPDEVEPGEVDGVLGDDVVPGGPVEGGAEVEVEEGERVEPLDGEQQFAEPPPFERPVDGPARALELAEEEPERPLPDLDAETDGTPAGSAGDGTPPA